MPRAVVFGCSGPQLSDAERRFFADADPLGFILFARNCIDPPQVRSLIAELRACVGRSDAPILIDQEGGRVQRLRPPHWRAAPPAGRFAELAKREPETAREAAWLNARIIADDLYGLGITIDCAPVLDVVQPGAHAVIGDRAAGDTPQRAIALGRAACEGLLAGGILPVIKHIPGHGRAGVDSHERLPVVDAQRQALAVSDFVPFRALRQMPWAMTAHVVYTAIDGKRPATTSRRVIEEVIRQAIGFEGVLISDDLCMGALSGSPAERTKAALAAGCDLVLHCNGELGEMEAVAAACPRVSAEARTRLARADAMRRPPEPFDRGRALVRLDALLHEAVA
jgi:beta-N-acetylhexosaminidase